MSERRACRDTEPPAGVTGVVRHMFGRCEITEQRRGAVLCQGAFGAQPASISTR
jgi:hypothetical protein